MSILQKLTEGIVSRDMSKEGAALLNKWEKTGLLEGLQTDQSRTTMARLLENQAKELLREAATAMNNGDVEGFASVAFPIVRRVFGSLIANDLVSVQPMSLPSGLIFFLDFTFQRDGLGPGAGKSLYGGDVVGQAVTGGVDLTGDVGTNAGQFYNLTNGYSSPSASHTSTHLTILYSGSYGAGTEGRQAGGINGGTTQAHLDKVYSLLQYDPAFTSGTTNFAIGTIPKSHLTGATNGTGMNFDDLTALKISNSSSVHHLRRLTQFSSSIGASAARNSTSNHSKLRNC